MSARLARSAFTSAARRTQTIASSSARVCRRPMSSTSHSGAKSNDTPWIVGSALLFGPALLYLLSPSAKKNTHPVHNDRRDFPTLKSPEHGHAPAKHVEPEVMKDDEGTVADVGSSIAVAEGSDVPKDSQSPEVQAKLLATASEAAESSEGEVPAAEANSESESVEGDNKSGTFQQEGETGPTDLSVAREAAQKGVAPKANN